MLKVIQDDGAGKQIVDIGLKDYWGNKTFVSVFDGKFQACIAKNPDYKTDKKKLESIGAIFVVPQKWLEVIDFKPEAVQLIQKHFNVSSEYLNQKFSIWNS
jgi:hypothetical protein